MDLKEIRQIIRIVESSNINEFELEEDGSRLRIIKSHNSKNGSYQSATTEISHQAPVTTAPVSNPISVPAPIVQETPVHETAANILEVRSPMVGTFYRAPSPDADPYVEAGDMVSVGQTLCIVEAMKLMNEIESEISGKIVKIAVENAQPVEYNQVLFLIETS
ncbi:MAG: acetyl-CoA carboxylase biotin carboxyl carrier protein [Calditrichaceae bacterium]|nr:acetyl-CoA carboxylase biotin carboxyl carrier protein [Calditrichaceae bacterium]MBN2709030.1 acetyl-CoA carboxylase biotin carboxyl carrier protein [Calditrichaceae bacterium]RQV96989.1 MAG: acetyl-CoA carboxylase biotin carboxyl carrier protein [Calditrichota bacterium]